MPIIRSIRVLAAAALLGCSAPLLAAITLVPVVSGGLASPVFVGHAGDGSNRLFVIEQPGDVRVLQPGASTTTVFLDIRSRILAGGERGLLGLAFHPRYASNGRFFVYYTRADDGAIVVAEYRVSANRDVADTAEHVLLTIPHAAAPNHNGGMLAFGPDGYLYIGVGDGGSANDPPNNAQNIDVLLGKILRIDVDHPNAAAGTLYSSPADNPFVNAPGADEIYAYGWRNPWRFSFDRATGAQWVADVGQGAREEVDTPVIKGGNYGWRIYEGSGCTGNGPAPCTPAPYVFPIFDYEHTSGRCSITGGYVYRGVQNALAPGTYVYGDYCTGEIFAWNGSAQTLLLDTAQSISSFGEDEAGEIYVVDLNGSVSRISTTTPCTFNVAPTTQAFGAAGGGATATVTAVPGCGWSATANASWLHVSAGSPGSGNGIVSYTADANSSGTARSGTLTIAGRTLAVSQAAAAAACSYAIAPTRANVPVGGAAASIAVTTGAGCAWTATSTISWIRIGGGASGTGSGTVTYVVDPYTDNAKSRTGTMTIAGKTFTVKQSKMK